MSMWEKIELDQLRQVTLSRRTLLQRAAVAGLATPTIAGLLAACGEPEEDDAAPAAPSDDDEDVAVDDAADDLDDTEEDADAPDDDGDVDDEAPDAEARRGGTLRVGFGGSADNFDPHHNVGFDSIWINAMMYSRLIRINHDMELEPELATSWEPSDDGMSWTFQLREDVQFHNGKEFTGEDVRATFERILDPDEGTPFLEQIEMIDEVEVVSDYEIILHLSAPYADIPMLLGNYFMRMIDIDTADSLQTEPVGTGPYMLESHSPGERTVLRRFEDYYNSEEEGFLDEIHYITIEEETSRLTALTSGDLHLINELSPAMMSMVEGQPGIVVEEMVTGSYQPVCMDVREEPFDDVRVRQALKLCAERSEILQAVVQGFGEEGMDHPIPSIDPMHADLGIPEQDHERARELLTEAGYEDGLDLVLHTTAGRAGLQEAALAMQEMCAPADIRIEVQNHPVDEFWADIWMNRPFYMSNWAGRPLADNALSIAYLSGAVWNETYWSNEEFDQLVRDARSVLEEDERREMLQRAQEILAEDGGAVIPYFMSIIGAWRDQLQGFSIHPLRMVELNWAYLED